METLARFLRTVHYLSPDGRHVCDRVYYLPVTDALEVPTKLGERVSFLDSVQPLVAVFYLRRRR
jgi:hypothetical protein